MKRNDKQPINEQSEINDTVSRLNDIHDELRELQFVTGFLAMAATNFEDKYSEEMLFGARLCFDMLDDRFDRVADHVSELTSEVKSI